MVLSSALLTFQPNRWPEKDEAGPRARLPGKTALGAGCPSDPPGSALDAGLARRAQIGQTKVLSTARTCQRWRSRQERGVGPGPWTGAVGRGRGAKPCEATRSSGPPRPGLADLRHPPADRVVPPAMDRGAADPESKDRPRPRSRAGPS